MDHRTFVIVGGGLAAGAAVTTLRTEGFDGRIVVFGTELHVPYERPPLSKEYLRGEAERSSLSLRPAAWYGEAAVELRLGETVARVHPSEHRIELADGERVPYDRLLLATGGRNRSLAVPGHDLDGVLGLRTVEDAERIRAEALRARKVVIVGGGFIGVEVAASLRSMGLEVEVVEFFALPLLRVVGEEVGRLYEAIHLDHGVRFRFGEAVQRFEGSGGRVEAVVTDRGSRVEGDFVVVGVGIQPNVEVVEGTEIAVENGVVVDEYLRATAPDVFAAGDVANHLHPVFGRRIRVEHYDNALKQGAAAARNMLGTDAVFDDTHWFWSDQFEHNLQYVGFAAEWDRFVVRGSLEERRFVGFYVRDGVVKVVVGVDRGRDVRRAAGLVRAARPVDLGALQDEDVDLKKLSRSLASTD